MTSLSIMRLVAPPGRIEAGEINFDGQHLLDLPENEMRKIRGNRISMIFQQPQSSLNPVWDVGRQIGEVLEIHRGMAQGWPRGREPSSCSRWSASPTRSAASRPIRTRCPAAWPSG